jgi:hypothetical protein
MQCQMRNDDDDNDDYRTPPIETPFQKVLEFTHNMNTHHMQDSIAKSPLDNACYQLHITQKIRN